MLTLIFSLTSFALIFRISGLEPDQFFTSFFFLEPVGVLLVLGILGLSYIADAGRLYTLARVGGVYLKPDVALKAALAGGFLTNISPFYVGASLLYITLMARRGLSWPKATALIVSGGALNLLIHLGLSIGILQANIYWSLTYVPEPLINLRGYLILGYTGLVFAFVAAYLLFKHRGKWLKGWGRPGEFLYQLCSGLNQIWFSGIKSLLWLLFSGTCYFFSFYGVGVFLGYLLEPEGPWMLFYPLQIGAYVLASVVPTPGASGGIELAALSAFSLLIALEYAAVLVIIWRVIVYYCSIFLGAPAFLLICIREEFKNGLKAPVTGRQKNNGTNLKKEYSTINEKSNGTFFSKLSIL